MNPLTIELSENHGDAGASNGEWTNRFQSNISLEDGDVLQIKQVLINSQSTISNGINIASDTVARITVGIYDNPAGGLGATYTQLPANMQQAGNDPYEYRWEIFDSAVAGYVESAGIDPTSQQYATPWVAMQWDGNQFTRLTVDVDVHIPRGVYAPDDISDIFTKALQTANVMQVFYDPTAKATGTSTTTQYQFFCLQSYYPTMNGKTQLDIADNANIYRGQFYATDGTNYVAGAPNPALVFENDRFKFNFFHTPILLNAEGDSSQAPYTQIGSANWGEDSDEFYSRYSGIYLTDLSVVSGESNIWTLLGFDDTATFTDDDCSNLESFTTTAFINDGAFENHLYSYPVRPSTSAQTFNYFVSTDISTSIDADSGYQYDESGYYLVNVISTFNNNYITEDSTMSKIACVASKQYSAGDFITAYAESGITYQHSGETILLSDLKCQILEPKTRQVAEDLGANSTIFLQIIKSQGNVSNGLESRHNKQGT